MRSLLNVSVATVLTVFGPARAMAGVNPGATIAGAVTLMAADGSTWPGDGARVALACGADRTRTEVADDHGAFRFLNAPVDSCSIEADLQGFVAQPVRVVTTAHQVVGTEIHLGVAPLRVGVNVTGTASSLAPKILRRSCLFEAGRVRERLSTKCTR